MTSSVTSRFIVDVRCLMISVASLSFPVSRGPDNNVRALAHASRETPSMAAVCGTSFGTTTRDVSVLNRSKITACTAWLPDPGFR